MTDETGLWSKLSRLLARASGGQVGSEAIQPDMPLKNLGIDSLKFIMLMLDIETELGRKAFNAQNIGRIETVQDLWHLVRLPSAATELT